MTPENLENAPVSREGCLDFVDLEPGRAEWILITLEIYKHFGPHSYGMINWNFVGGGCTLWDTIRTGVRRSSPGAREIHVSLKVLLLDYSTDRSEAAAIRRWLPADAEVTVLYIEPSASFPDDLVRQGFTHVIHSGSALSITEKSPITEKAARFIQGAREAGVAQMGICYGHQLLCLALVGERAVRSSPNGFEAGWREVAFDRKELQIPGVGEREIVWQSHFDEVTALPDGSCLFASSPHTRIQGWINQKQRLLGTQFHPEFDRQAGNEIYLKDRKLLEKHGYDVDRMLRRGPSIDTGSLFFGYFLDKFSS